MGRGAVSSIAKQGVVGQSDKMGHRTNFPWHPNSYVAMCLKYNSKKTEMRTYIFKAESVVGFFKLKGGCLTSTTKKVVDTESLAVWR